MNVDFTIVGGGVIGLTLARHLSNEGHSVAVIEKNQQLANEASQAGGGIISPLHPWRYSEPMLALARWSHAVYPDLAKELSFSTGIHVPIVNTGMLVPDTSEASQALSCNFLKASRVSKEQVLDIEPGISNPQESVWVPEVNNIRNPALCRALTVDITNRKDVSVYAGVHINKVLMNGSSLDIHTDKYEKISTGKLIIATGAWTTKLVENLFPQSNLDWPTIYPVKGQMLAVKTHVGTVRSVVLKDHHYVIPRHDGVVVVGSTVEHEGFNRDITTDALDKLQSFAYQLFPALHKCKLLSQWSGFRPGIDRDSPIISSIEGLPNVYLSAGHFRNGLLSAPASAQLMVDILLEQDSSFDVDAYSL